MARANKPISKEDQPKLLEDHVLTTPNGKTLTLGTPRRNVPAGRAMPEEVHHRWYKVLALHLAGRKNKEIAEEVGYEPNTVSAILADERMRVLRQQLLDDNWKEFEALQAKVVSTIDRKLDSEDEGVQLAAAQMWLKAAQKYGVKQGTINVTAEDVVLQILQGNVVQESKHE